MIRHSTFLAAALVIAPGLHAQSAAPAPVPPPTDSVVASVVAAIQQGTPQARGAVVATALSPRTRQADSARIDNLLATLHRQGAPFVVQEAGRMGRSVLLSLSSPSTGRTAVLQVGTDRVQPPGVSTISVLESHASVVDSLEWPSGAGLADAALVRVIDGNLARAAAADAFSGVVYVAARDSVIYARAFGMADRDRNVPLVVESRFAMASMTKMLTAVAVLRMVERGELRLDQTIGEVLPRYPNADRARSITIRHLLEHTSGMGSQWGTPRRPVPGLTGSLATAAAIAHPPLLFEPGTRWSYSNEGYTVLAAVLEQLSGSSYAEVIAREVLGPAGMTETVVATARVLDSIPHRAIGYYPEDDDVLGVRPLRANTERVGAHEGGGAGGGFSTAADLARLGKALRAGILLSKPTLDSMWTGRWDIPGHDGQRYGWGAFVQPVDRLLAVGHGGGGSGSGIDTGFRHFTDGSYTVVVLTNIDPPAATQFTAAITRLLGEAGSARQ